jgi:hypothetical protein
MEDNWWWGQSKITQCFITLRYQNPETYYGQFGLVFHEFERNQVSCRVWDARCTALSQPCVRSSGIGVSVEYTALVWKMTDVSVDNDASLPSPCLHHSYGARPHTSLWGQSAHGKDVVHVAKTILSNRWVFSALCGIVRASHFQIKTALHFGTFLTQMDWG